MNRQPLRAVWLLIAGLLSGAVLSPSAALAQGAAQPRADVSDVEVLRFAARWPTFSNPQTPHPAVARIIAPERDGLSLGSGTLIDANDQYGLVVTNWHVVRGAAGPVEAVFPDGFRSPGRVVRTDKEWDLAAILIWKPPAQPVPVAGEAPRPGQWLTIAGYGSGNYKAQSGPCTQYLAPGINRPFEIVEVKAAARQGDSGGPIFNEEGELAGVLFGQRGGRTSGSYAGRVRKFLELTAADLRHLPPAHASTEALAGAPAGNPVTPTPPIARLNGYVEAASASEQATQGRNAVEPLLADAVSKIAAVRPSASSDSDARPSRNLAISEPAAEATYSVTYPRPRGLRWSEEIKMFLAAVGLAAIVLHAIRWTTSK